jgi:hypothetical protein
MFEKIIAACAGLKKWQIEEQLWKMYYGRSSRKMKTAIFRFAKNNNLMLAEPSID